VQPVTVGEPLLQPGLPEPGAVAVAAAAVGQDQQFVRPPIPLASVASPPRRRSLARSDRDRCRPTPLVALAVSSSSWPPSSSVGISATWAGRAAAEAEILASYERAKGTHFEAHHVNLA